MGKKGKRVETITESDTGRNQRFKDIIDGTEMTRSEFVKEIKKDNYKDYHIRKINGLDTPVSNPDKKKNNNLD